jgi:rhodanese-related sulfurtransferase
MQLSRSARVALWSGFGVSAALLTLWWIADHRRGVAWAISVVARRFPDVPQLPAATLAEWLGDANRTAPFLIDARSAEEFATSHLAGAERVDLATPDAGLCAVAPLNRPLVVYCSAGYRASQLARRLLAAGHRDVANLAGGIFQWANEGRPVHRDGRPVAEVHPFMKMFGRLLHPARRI